MREIGSKANAVGITLEDRYVSPNGTVLLNGSQAMVRLMLEQARADRDMGYNTAGFVSGYRGSPLGGVDQAFWSAAKHLDQMAIAFKPGLNEDLAATAVWGTQQIELLGGGEKDGVFALWFGKNPGVDRSGDVFKHANINGTSSLGGVLAISGDDPGATSSTIPNQCEQSFAAALIPVLYPADIHDILAFGRLGFEMSRYSGLWVAMKTVADTVESTATIDLDLLPKTFATPARPIGREDVVARWPDDRWSQDRRLQEVKLPAALDFAAANRIDKIVVGENSKKTRRIGIVSAGKPYLDVLEALALLGIDEAVAEDIGLSVYKVAMIWPLEPSGLRDFAEGLEEVIVVEERRAFMETQFKDIAYHWPAEKRPRVLGKTDAVGKPMFSALGETSPTLVAGILGAHLLQLSDHPTIRSRYEKLKALKNSSNPQKPSPVATRIPHFCAGCPHSRSTELPENSVAMAGIGCHSLSMWMEGRNTRLLTHMGGEGANWIGAAAFVDMPHIFQNMGDGTYTHSGILAIRAAVAADVPITYKILYNDAVAMTGGQPVEGAPRVGDIARQILAERIGKLVVVSDHPDSFNAGDLPPGVPLHHRDRLDEVMEDCREWSGVSVIIYDQVCATEKRRRIKSGDMAQPDVRVVINQRVCEGCGDCSTKSGCVAIESIETPFGTKRRINQSVCNTDLSCLDGFCPAMVTVEAARLRKPQVQAGGLEWEASLLRPSQMEIDKPVNILIAGVGGTGLITIGAIVGMAAHLEGKQCTILDNTGLARKGGAVTTHLRIATSPQHLHAPRIDIGGCDLLLAGDPVVAASPEVLARMAAGRSRGIVNSHAIPTASQAQNPDLDLDIGGLLGVIENATGQSGCLSIDASGLAKALLGDDIFANMILLGVAFQDGRVPVSIEALKQAIELNGIAVAANLQALAWGRRYVVDAKTVLASAKIDNGAKLEPLDRVISRFADELSRMHNSSLASEYSTALSGIRANEGEGAESASSVSHIVARNYYKLLAPKDEFEVARLMIADDFEQELASEFETIDKIHYHFASPVRGRGRGYKKSFGPWLRPVLGVLASLKNIRNTIADPFRYQSERRLERRLLALYSEDLKRICELIQNGDVDNAQKLANWPDDVRGFGFIKEKNARNALQCRDTILAQYEKSRMSQTNQQGPS